jgi:hypothetical protein
MMPVRVTLLMMAGAVAVAAVGGCGLFDGNKADQPTGPVPVSLGPTEPGVRTLTLRWNLPEVTEPPRIATVERIEIEDSDGRVCPVRAVAWGMGAQGHWVSIRFMFPPDAQRIHFKVRWRTDERTHPLTAILTRVNPQEWRADYGMAPPPKSQ